MDGLGPFPYDMTLDCDGKELSKKKAPDSAMSLRFSGLKSIAVFLRVGKLYRERMRYRIKNVKTMYYDHVHFLSAFDEAFFPSS